MSYRSGRVRVVRSPRLRVPVFARNRKEHHFHDELDTYDRMSFDCLDTTPLHFWKDLNAGFTYLLT